MKEKTDKQVNIVSVAENQKAILLIIFLRIILVGFYIFYVRKRPENPLNSNYLLYALDFALGVAAIYYFYRLLRSMNYSITVIILLCIAVFLPAICLIVVFLINNSATNLLKEAGLPVALLGARKRDITAYEESEKQKSEAIEFQQNAVMQNASDAGSFGVQNLSPKITPKRVVSTKSSFRTMAKLSCILPLSVFTIGFSTNRIFVEKIPRVVGIVIGFAIIATIIIGFLLSVISFFGVRKKGVLSWAILGFLFNLLMFVMIPVIAQGIREAKQRVEEIRNMDIEAEKEMTDLRKKAFLEYPGWLAMKQYGKGFIMVASYDDASPYIAKLRAYFQMPFSLLIVEIDNRHGETTIKIDPSSVQMQKRDSTVIKALTANSVLNTAYKDKDEFLRLYSGVKEIKPGAVSSDGLVFLPNGTDMSKIMRISITVDGKSLILNGQYLTARQKQEMEKASKKANSK